MWKIASCTEAKATWWRHQMEPFSALLALCAGHSPVPVNSPHKGQWRGAFRFSLICAWINDWVNSREAGDLRSHRGHYDVSVMQCHDNAAIAGYIPPHRIHRSLTGQFYPQIVVCRCSAIEEMLWLSRCCHEACNYINPISRPHWRTVACLFWVVILRKLTVL